MLSEISSDETEEEVISTTEIKEVLAMWEKVLDFVVKKHPEKVATGRALVLCNDTYLTHVRNIVKKRQKQTSLDKYFLKRPSVDTEESVAKAKIVQEKRPKDN